jgi:glycosyltransferase involved in cell wall biosynthesis
MPQTKKVAVLYAPGSAEWGSCHTIGQNLTAAYRLFGKLENVRVDFLKYQKDIPGPRLDAMARKILAGNYACLCFIEHSPLPLGLVKALMTASKGAELPPLIFHLYGDFTFYAPSFLSTIYLLRGQRLRLVCASPKQVGLVQSLVDAPAGAVGYCPFPVDTGRFQPNPRLRAAERKALGWEEDEFVLLYTGRLSLQKNITMLLKETFRHLATRKDGKKVRVALAGAYDDLGAPFFGIYPAEEEYFFRTKKTLEALSPALGSVDLLGNLSANRLQRVYNAADAYMSLSLHHDEDYGMAPAEALACGLPCLLSDWGGFPAFAAINSKSGKRVWLVPPRLEKSGISFLRQNLDSALREILAIQQDFVQRENAVRDFLKLFSIESVARQIQREVSAAQGSPPLEIKPAFVTLSQRTLEQSQEKRRNIYSGFDDPLYSTVYQAYLEPSAPSKATPVLTKDRTCKLDWFTPLHAICARAQPKSVAERRLYQMLFPLIKEYSGGAVPAIFLHFLRDLQELNSEKITVARDGAIPLLQFFQRHPTPDGIKTRVAVHEELLSCVPPPWQSVIASYRVVSRQPQSGKASSVFLFGLNTKGAISLASCTAALKKNATRISQSKKRFLYLPTRFFSEADDDQTNLQIAQKIFASLGPGTQVVNWNRLPDLRGSSRCFAVDLGEKMIVADPSLLHSLGKMGIFLDAKAVAKGEQLLPLSPHHGLAVDFSPKFPKLTSALRKRHEQELLSTPLARALMGVAG